MTKKYNLNEIDLVKIRKALEKETLSEAISAMEQVIDNIKEDKGE